MTRVKFGDEFTTTIGDLQEGDWLVVVNAHGKFKAMRFEGILEDITDASEQPQIILGRRTSVTINHYQPGTASRIKCARTATYVVANDATCVIRRQIKDK
jgi:hypothetical protein